MKWRGASVVVVCMWAAATSHASASAAAPADRFLDYDLGPCKEVFHEVAACEQREFAKQTVALNQVYSKLYRLYDADQRRTLRLAERTWVQFRDRDCDSAGTQFFYLMPLGDVDVATKVD